MMARLQFAAGFALALLISFTTCAARERAATRPVFQVRDQRGFCGIERQ